MPKHTIRGFVPEDERNFGLQTSLVKLKKASEEIQYLLNRGYSIKNTTVFVGNHYLFSERQRLALTRSISRESEITLRKKKEVMYEKTVHIDGFNTIITLEVALSNSLLLEAMDGTIRDLAGLRGTYRLIEYTTEAILLILEELQERNVEKAIFYLDEPVSNSGKLKVRILELAESFPFEVEVILLREVDRTLQTLSGVITSDAIILNHCESWINLNRDIIFNQLPDSWIVKLWE